MKKKEFITSIRAEFNVIVESITRVVERGNKGWKIEYRLPYRDDDMIFTEAKIKEAWVTDLEDAYTMFNEFVSHKL